MRDFQGYEITPNHRAQGSIIFLDFSKEVLEKIVGPENSGAILGNSISYNEDYILPGGFSDDGVIGLPETKEDVLWLIYDELKCFVDLDAYEEIKRGFLKHWDELNCVLQYAKIVIEFYEKDLSRVPDFDDPDYRGFTLFESAKNEGYATWTYELINGIETISFQRQPSYRYEAIEEKHSRAVEEKHKEYSEDELIKFTMNEWSAQFPKKIFLDSLAKRSLQLEDFTCMTKTEECAYSLQIQQPAEENTVLNNHAISLGCGKYQKWIDACESIFLQISFLSEFVQYPYKGANCHARDLYLSMSKPCWFFRFLKECCTEEYAVNCLIDYLVFLETVYSEGISRMVERFKMITPTKKNGTLHKARVTFVELKDCISQAFQNYRIAFRCRNISDNEAEFELNGGFVVGFRNHFTPLDSVFSALNSAVRKDSAAKLELE